MSELSNETTKRENLKNELWWWLSKGKPFVINNEYSIQLLHVDTKNYSAKILIKNLKNNEVQESIMELDNEKVS